MSNTYITIIGFFIIKPDHISIASKRDINVGSVNVIAIHNPELLDQVFRGETIFVPPITSMALTIS